MRTLTILFAVLALSSACQSARPTERYAPKNPGVLRVAMCQMPVVQGEPERNLETFERFVQMAGAAGADVAVFPETARLGWAADETRRMATPIPGHVTEQLGRAARRHRLYIVAGLAEKAPDGVYNSAVLIDPDGQVAFKHRKTWIVSRSVLQVDLYEQGRRLEVAQTPLGTVATLICADNQRESFLPTVAHLGARMVFVPGAWAAPPEELDQPEIFEKTYIDFWKKTFAPASARGKLYIFAVNGVGPMTQSPWAGREFWGVSLAYGPDGTLLAIGKRREEDLIVVEIPVE